MEEERWENGEDWMKDDQDGRFEVDAEWLGAYHRPSFPTGALVDNKS